MATNPYGESDTFSNKHLGEQLQLDGNPCEKEFGNWTAESLQIPIELKTMHRKPAMCIHDEVSLHLQPSWLEHGALSMSMAFARRMKVASHTSTCTPLPVSFAECSALSMMLNVSGVQNYKMSLCMHSGG